MVEIERLQLRIKELQVKLNTCRLSEMADIRRKIDDYMDEINYHREYPSDDD